MKWSGAGLGDSAERFFEDGGEAAALLPEKGCCRAPGRGGRCSAATIRHGHELGGDFRARSAVRRCSGAEDFGSFGEDGGASGGDEHVHGETECGVGGDPDQASEPPHCMPMMSPLSGCGVRVAALAAGSMASTSWMPRAMAARVPPSAWMWWSGRFAGGERDDVGGLILFAAEAEEKDVGEVGVVSVAAVVRRRTSAASPSPAMPQPWSA